MSTLVRPADRPTTQRSPAGQPAERRLRRSALVRSVHYAVQSIRLTLRNVSFVLFTVAMPVILYVLFSRLFGGQGEDGTQGSAMVMVSMAAYGSLGAAMNGGAQLAAERRTGWFRQLMVTGLPTRTFLWARAVAIMVVVLPALLLVLAAGAGLGGVRAPAAVWATSLVSMWLALVPMAALGIVVGLWVKVEAVQGVSSLLLLVMALLGGLWFPTAYFPSAMQAVARCLPSYWLAELGRWAFLPDSTFPWRGVVVLVAWAAVLGGLGALGYRRAVAASAR